MPPFSLSAVSARRSGWPAQIPLITTSTPTSSIFKISLHGIDVSGKGLARSAEWATLTYCICPFFLPSSTPLQTNSKLRRPSPSPQRFFPLHLPPFTFLSSLTSHRPAALNVFLPMARGTRAYHNNRLQCSVCKAPCETRRGLASHHRQSRECFNALLKKSQTSAARAKRAAQSRHRRNPHPPATPSLPEDIAADEPIPEFPLPPVNPPPRQHRYVSVEEVPDEDMPTSNAVIDFHPYAGAVYEGTYPTAWDQRLAADVKAKREPWHSFNSMEDWDVAKWLMTSGVSQAEMNKFLQLSKVRLFLGCPCRTVLMIFSRYATMLASHSRTRMISSRRSTALLLDPDFRRRPLPYTETSLTLTAPL